MKMFFLILNYTLSFFMWMIIGRFILALFVKRKDNIILSFFTRFTDPVLNVAARLMPSAGQAAVTLAAIGLLVAARILLVIAFSPFLAGR